MQVRADGVETVIAGQPVVEPVCRQQSGKRTVDFAYCDCPAQHGRRVASQRDEFVVPGEDLWPVGLVGSGRVVVEGGDRCLDLVLAAPVLGQRGPQDADAFGDLFTVPQRPVLLIERD